MKAKNSNLLTISLAAAALALAGTAYAGGGGGCNYGAQIAELETQQTLVQADATDPKIDPKWLKLLEQPEDAGLEGSAPLIVHN